MSDFGNHLESNDLRRSSSDEKMDTASESFPSTQDTQGTPNSILSSDFEEQEQPELLPEPVEVLRLQNPSATNVEDTDTEEGRYTVTSDEEFTESIGKCNVNSIHNLEMIESTQDIGKRPICLENGSLNSVLNTNLVQILDEKSSVSSYETDSKESVDNLSAEKVDSKKSTNVLRLNNPVKDNQNYRDGDTDYGDSVNEDVKIFKSDFDDAKMESPIVCGDGVLNDSLMNKMSHLRLDSLDTPEEKKNRPLRLGISPPRLSSTLTLTSDHPLMGVSSPDPVDNYPDLVPEKPRIKRIDEDHTKDLSLSSIEDDKFHNNESNFSDFYQDGVYRNTSKNNLYFSDNFSTIDSHLESKSQEFSSTPDVARVQNSSKSFDGRRKIIPIFRETEHIIHKKVLETPKTVLGRDVGPNLGDKAINAYVEERNKKERSRDHFEQLLKIDVSQPLDISPEELDCGPVDWVESPSQLRSMPNFQLPVELSSPRYPTEEECASPDVLSSSTQDDNDRSTYKAMVDPYSGNVALKHTTSQNHNHSAGRRRIIAVVDTEDRCSLDSVSASSINSEEADLPEAERTEPIEETAGLDVGAEPVAGPGDVKEDCDSDDDSRGNSQSDYSEPIPEYSFEEEMNNERNWLKITLPTGGYLRCDMKVIEPYKRVLSHGGYRGRSSHIIVFSACHLPDCARRDYSYVMDNLFLYVVYTLDRLVSDEYELVYLHGSASKHRMPNFHWLKKSYHLVDRRLRKSLKHLYLVHPTFWLKSIVFMSKPFISSKFSRKLSYVHSLGELYERVPVEPAAIPDLVKEFDSTRNR